MGQRAFLPHRCVHLLMADGKENPLMVPHVAGLHVKYTASRRLAVGLYSITCMRMDRNLLPVVANVRTVCAETQVALVVSGA